MVTKEDLKVLGCSLLKKGHILQILYLWQKYFREYIKTAKKEISI